MNLIYSKAAMATELSNQDAFHYEPTTMVLRPQEETLSQLVEKEKKNIKNRLQRQANAYRDGASGYIKRRGRRLRRRGHARRLYHAMNVYNAHISHVPYIGPLYTDPSLGNLTLRRQDLHRRVKDTPVMLGWNFLTMKEAEDLQTYKIYM